MARDIFKNSQIVEVNGALDKTDTNDLVVYIEQKDAPPLAIDIVQLLEDNAGKQIACKLIYEQVM